MPLLVFADQGVGEDDELAPDGEDRWGNRWMVKERSLNKIDPAVAVWMALGAAAGGPSLPVIDVRAMIA